MKKKKGVYDAMSGKKEQKFNWDHLPPMERLKYEIADELGLLDRVRENGWKSLSAKETGRIGGLMTRRKRELDQVGQKTELF